MKQLLYELKSQPLISLISVVGVALAIFLIMVVVMLQQVKVIPISPENDRDRMLYVNQGCILSADRSSFNANSGFSYATVKALTTDLPGVEAAGTANGAKTVLVSIQGKPTFMADTRSTDRNYFNLFDFNFLAGQPYTDADINAGIGKAVITETIARDGYDSAEDAIGKTIEVDGSNYTICGVVTDQSPVTENAYSQIYTTIAPEDPTSFWTQMGLGGYSMMIKAGDRANFTEIADELYRRAAIYSTQLALEDQVFEIYTAPADQAGFTYGSQADNTNVEKARRSQWLLYLILLLIPAINLSSMTRSRLRRRIGDIGVRRAFGCTRSRIVWDILSENFVITLVGGVLGLIACIIFGSLLFDAVYKPANFWASYSLPATVSFSDLLDWHMFGYALLFCFILNLISTGVPAIKASRVNPVEAINSNSR